MNDLNLRALESQTWRANQRDGLFDLFFAVIFVGLALSQLADGLWDNGAATLGLLIAVEAAGAVGLWQARRRITRPRLGVVHFAAARKRRVLVTRIVLALCVTATLALVLVTGLSTGGFSRLVTRTTVSAVAAAVILVPMTAIALLQDFPRILLHAMLFVGAEFGGTLLEGQAAVPFPRAILFAVAATISAAVGGVILWRFLTTTRPLVEVDAQEEKE